MPSLSRSLVTCGLLLLGSAAATAKQKTPKEIIEEATDQTAFRAKGIEMQMIMRLKDKSGSTRDRTMYARAQRKDGLSKTLVRFLAPADVAGTSFLFVENKTRDDDQYMYLPALKIHRRIVGSQKNQSFMGSDLTYADLEWRSLEDATYKMLPEKKIGADPCYVIESVPKSNDDYARTVSWIRKKDNVLLRLHFFDRKNKLLKVLSVKEIKVIEGMRLATKMKIANAQTGHATFVAIGNVKARNDLNDEQFTVRALLKR